MKKWTVAFLLWCSCAPLTSPAGGPEEWQKPERLLHRRRALEQYLKARQHYGSGPRPDFEAVVRLSMSRVSRGRVERRIRAGQYGQRGAGDPSQLEGRPF